MADYKKGDTASWDTEQVRRSQTGQPARKKKRRKKKNIVLRFILYVFLVALTSALMAGVGWMLITDFCAFNKPLMKTTVEVKADDSLETVSEKLYDAGLIKYKWFFQLYADISNAEEKIGIGTYELNTDMDYHALIVGMRSSSGGNMTAETVTVTIPEGYTVEQTIKLLAKNGVNTEEALTEAAQTYDFKYEFIDNDSEDINRLEGYLFPDTYEFYVNEKPANALGRLLRNFNSKLDDELLKNAEARGYDLKDIVIIASLVEKETDGTDHAKIASVIYNRLENVGETANLLQIDAALLYGLPDHEGALTNEDKAVDTPYNLYMHKGLPPTAIANPGLDSLLAALEPEETNYYFYALSKSGTHHFSETLQEHNNFLNSGNYAG